ncbi:MAG: hypothetical protein M1830_004551, partial [Pleopsidium flavum]
MTSIEGGLHTTFLDELDCLRDLARFQETHRILRAELANVLYSSRREVLLLRQSSETLIAQGHITEADTALRTALSLQVADLTAIERAILDLQFALTSLRSSVIFPDVVELCKRARHEHLRHLSAATVSRDQ